MANTYTLISSNVLGSSAASVTFSSIPSTYTDLVLRCSTRTTAGNSYTDNILIYINGVGSSTLYSATFVQGNGATASSSRASNTYPLYTNYGDGSQSTSNTFGSLELYIPNYNASQNKPVSIFNVAERDQTNAGIEAAAELWRSTSAITSLGIYSGTSSNFVSGSSFYLYGIKNS